MERTSFSINFVCRESKSNKKGFAPVEMYIIYDKERVFFTLKRKEIPSVFKEKIGSKKSNDLKTFCYEQYSMVQSKLTEMNQLGLVINANTIKEYIAGKKNIYTIDKLFHDFFKEIENKPMSEKNYNKYIIVKKSFKDFIDFNLSTEEITYNIILKYQIWLKNHYEMSTVAGYLQHLKSVILFGMSRNVIKVNPFNGIKIEKKLKEVVTITEDEFDVLCKKKFSIERLNKVKDLFVLSCSCGLAYCDIISLKKEDFTFEDNRVIIIKKRQKTNITYYSVVLNEGVKILEKYDYDLSCLNLSNQKCNSYLKEIQDLCDIKVNLHFHLARHFYLTKLINSGIPLDIVSKCAGHSNTRITVHYAKQMQSTVKKSVLDAFENIK